jgi:hypothetical protein
LLSDSSPPASVNELVVDTLFPAPGSVLDLGELEFGLGPRLRGVLRDSEGEAAAEAELRLEFDDPNGPGDRTATCDEHGRFEFASAPQLPGVLRARYDHRGQAELRLENVAAAARSGEVSLTLLPPATVRGQLRWNRAVRRGVPQIAVVARDAFGQRRLEQSTAARESGEFELTAWPGSYEVWLQWLGDETWIEGPRVTLEFGRVSNVEWTVD